MNAALSLRGVHHRFGAAQALAAVDLDVDEGEIYGFLGLNGAGKTTTIRLIVGLLRLQSGSIRLFGSEVASAPAEVSRNVGVLFEDFAAHSYLTGREQLRLQARLLGLPRPEGRKAAELWLEKVGIAAKATTRIKHYSLGMKRRLGLACALVGSPRIVILDEPTNGLDPQGIADLRGQILELNAQAGVTFFLSSHILGEVEQLCRRVGILHAGRIHLEGAVKDLTNRSDAMQRQRLRVRPVATARQILASASWCHGVTGEPGDEGALRVELKPSDVPRLVRELVQAEVEVYEVASCVESLEAVFQKVVAEAAVAAAKA